MAIRLDAFARYVSPHLPRQQREEMHEAVKELAASVGMNVKARSSGCSNCTGGRIELARIVQHWLDWYANQ